MNPSFIKWQFHTWQEGDKDLARKNQDPRCLVEEENHGGKKVPDDPEQVLLGLLSGGAGASLLPQKIKTIVRK